ncbi:MAG: choice-of-anchor A family protein, partial [Alistipes sp.]|nr:choice-of-anchor A family protein [Alistipes sp.]
MKKTLGKRLISGAASVMLALSAFAQAVPLGLGKVLNVGAANQVTNLDGSKTTDDVTLLVGNNPTDPNGNPYFGDGKNFSSVDAAIEQFNADYALGIASQFAVFVKEDFKTTSADTEGRLAVGGNISIDNPYGENGAYEIGKGDFNTMVPLSSLLNTDGFAEVIWDGKPDTTFWNINCKGYYIPTVEGGYDKPYDGVIPKRLAVQNPDGESYVKTSYGAWLNNFYNAQLIDFSDETGEFATIEQRSADIAELSSDFDKNIDVNKVISINYFHQPNYDGEMYGDFQIKEGVTGVAEFTYQGNDSDNTVYLSLTMEEYEQVAKCKVIKYNNIPDNAYIIINITGVNGNNIVFNSSDSAGTPDRYTYINDVSISKGAYTVVDDDGKATDISLNGVHVDVFRNTGEIKATTGDIDAFNTAFGNHNTTNWYESKISGWYNNYPDVDRILYNFPDATGTIDYGKGASQGTILAPLAHVSALEETGHLSGALIAKSFEGKTEFGYRPFRGPISILGVDSKYTIDFYKYITGTDTLLDGAEFLLTKTNEAGVPYTANSELVQYDEKGNLKEIKDDAGNNINVPAEEMYLTLSKGHMRASVSDDSYYKLTEVKAPDGYKLDETTAYYIHIPKAETKKAVYSGDAKPTFTATEYVYNEAEGITPENKDYVAVDKGTTRVTVPFGDSGCLMQIGLVGSNVPADLTLNQMILRYNDGAKQDKVFNINKSNLSGIDWLEFATKGSLSQDECSGIKEIVFVVNGTMPDSVDSPLNIKVKKCQSADSGDWTENGSFDVKIYGGMDGLETVPPTKYYKLLSEENGGGLKTVNGAGVYVEGVKGVQIDQLETSYDEASIIVYKSTADDKAPFSGVPYAEGKCSGIDVVSAELSDSQNTYEFELGYSGTVPRRNSQGQYVDKDGKVVENEKDAQQVVSAYIRNAVITSVDENDGAFESVEYITAGDKVETGEKAALASLVITKADGTTETIDVSKLSADEQAKNEYVSTWNSISVHSVEQLTNADGVSQEISQSLVYDGKFIPMVNNQYVVQDIVPAYGYNPETWYELTFDENGVLVQAYSSTEQQGMGMGFPGMGGQQEKDLTSKYVRSSGNDDSFNGGVWYGFDNNGVFTRYTANKISEGNFGDPFAEAVPAVYKNIYRIDGILCRVTYSNEGYTIIKQLNPVNLNGFGLDQSNINGYDMMGMHTDGLVDKVSMRNNEFIITVGTKAIDVSLNLTSKLGDDEQIRFYNSAGNPAPKKSISISKRDITKGDEEIAGAVITITLDSDSTLNQEEVASNNELTYSEDGKSLTFTSIDKATVIMGLPDGKYVLEEITAPSDDYEKVESAWSFTIKDGKLSTTEETDTDKSHVVIDSEDDTHVIVNDAPKKISEIHISKKE